MSGPDPERFDAFDARLKKAREQRQEAPERGAVDRSGMGTGLQAGIDVVAGVIGGLLIGWALDRWLGTSPVLLVVFLFLGAAAGTRNAFRTLQRLMEEGDRR
ncbi:MAG: AtpZ/AtpI family protein [Geminicoccaceae bacterium]|nr:MAG: AtpZ/AtpI family protein [Geminicoccaceae bacterium]